MPDQLGGRSPGWNRNDQRSGQGTLAVSPDTNMEACEFPLTTHYSSGLLLRRARDDQELDLVRHRSLKLPLRAHAIYPGSLAQLIAGNCGEKNGRVIQFLEELEGD
jgi:hypothetical protein